MDDIETRLARIEEKLDRLLQIHETFERETTTLTMPWTSRLLLEHATGLDQDGNGKVYGIDFAFSQSYSSLPQALRTVAEYIDQSYSGGRMTLLDYIKTLAPSDPSKSSIIEHLERFRDK